MALRWRGNRQQPRRSPAIPNDGSVEKAKRVVNHALTRATGYQLTRAATTVKAPARVASGPRKRVDRLVKSPTFILSSERSGSTLLRVILNSHSQIHAPHELHLRYLRVSAEKDYAALAMKQVGLDERKLEHLLWDRVLERELTASGKQVIVDKTPNIVFIWQRLREAWPDARFIFLLRHPAAIANSLARARRSREDAYEGSVKRVWEYGQALEEARASLPGLVVRYEELVAEPERVSAAICDYLGVPWEPTMLDYGEFDHGKLVPRIGDWGQKIRSGHIDSNITLPTDDEVPPLLEPMSRAWGYLGTSS